MSAGSVGAVVRARAAASRRVGAGQVPSLASSSSLAEALSRLASGPYGHDARPGQGLRRAQHEVAATYLWNLRVLAGWAPREGARALRLLAGWAEIANVEGLLRRFDGDPDPVPPYRLGSLATAWPLLERATDRAELRRELAATAWGDPGGEDDHAVTLVLRLVWAARVRSGVPAATTWAAGAAALFLALDLCLSARPHDPTVTAAAARVLGQGAAAATTLEELRAALPTGGAVGPGRLLHGRGPVAGRGGLVAAGGARRDGHADLPPVRPHGRPGGGRAAGGGCLAGARRARDRRPWRCSGGGARCPPLSASARSSMRRIALVAPRTGLRPLLVRVAAAGVVEVETAGGETPAGPATRALQRLGSGGTRAALLEQVPDLDRLERSGRVDLIAGEAALEQVAAAAVTSPQAAAVAGWTPADEVDRLAAEVGPLGGSVVPLPRPRGVQPPTLLRRRGGSQPFTALVQTYSTVPYADVDPTPFAATAYVVMFGLMFGDVGHGLLLVLLAGLARAGRPHVLARLRPAVPLVAAAGAASILAGAAYGEFFGPTGVVAPLWLAPLEDPLRLLLAGLAVGALLLAVAYAIGTVNRVREGGWSYALYAPSGLAGSTLFLGCGTARGRARPGGGLAGPRRGAGRGAGPGALLRRALRRLQPRRVGRGRGG